MSKTLQLPVDGVITLKEGVDPPLCNDPFDVYDAWVDRRGNCYEVADESHNAWARTYYSDEGYAKLEQAGWLHISCGNCYYYPKMLLTKISRGQELWLEKWVEANEYGRDDYTATMLLTDGNMVNR